MTGSSSKGNQRTTSRPSGGEPDGPDADPGISSPATTDAAGAGEPGTPGRPEPATVRVRFGVHLGGYRPGEVAEVADTATVRNLAAGGALQIIDGESPQPQTPPDTVG